MPVFSLAPAAATAFWGAVGTGAATGASLYGAHKQSQSANRAQQIQSNTDAETIRLERERDAEAKRQWDTEQAFQQQQFAAQEDDRLFNRRLLEQRDARAEPYRQASAAAVGRLGQMLGLSGRPAPAPTFSPVVANGGLTYQRRPAVLGPMFQQQ